MSTIASTPTGAILNHGGDCFEKLGPMQLICPDCDQFVKYTEGQALTSASATIQIANFEGSGDTQLSHRDTATCDRERTAPLHIPNKGNGGSYKMPGGAVIEYIEIHAEELAPGDRVIRPMVTVETVSQAATRTDCVLITWAGREGLGHESLFYTGDTVQLQTNRQQQ